MKNLIIEDGLLLTDMELTFKGQLLHLQRVLVDTGSGSTVVSTDLIELLDHLIVNSDNSFSLTERGYI